MLEYYVGIHGSQGITLGKFIVDIGDKEFQVNLNNVVLSRGKTLAGLLFSFNLLLNINRSTQNLENEKQLYNTYKVYTVYNMCMYKFTKFMFYARFIKFPRFIK